MARASATPAWQVALIVLTSTVVGVAVLAALYWTQAICIPVALALYLSFLLAPLVTATERRGLGRTPSVLLVVLAVVLVLGAVGWMIGAQARSLADEMPTYAKTIQARLGSVRQLANRVGTIHLERILGELTELKPAPDRPVNSGPEAAKEPIAVALQPGGLDWLKAILGVLGRTAEAIGSIVVVLVLLIFMLLNRHEMRNRLIRLAGDGRITATTKALDDAAQRIRQFLRVQLIVNAAFGLTLAIGLMAIGVHYAFLMGFLGFLLRYLPYVGPWIAAAPPLLLSLAMSGGWMQPLAVLGLFVTIELVTSSVVEPRLYSHSIGVSEVALLVAAASWALLWGPIGLVLSSPLTVCLVALGKYVPTLGFLDVILGDEPVLPPDITIYQRLLARDQDEAEELIRAQIKTSSLEKVYDGPVVSVLNHLICDGERDELTDADEQFVLEAIKQILDDLRQRHDAAMVSDGDTTAPPQADAKVRILACPARNQADRLALVMLEHLLDPAKWELHVTGAETLASEVVRKVGEGEFKLVCIGALASGGVAHIRYLCKRLRARHPDIRIVVGRWGLKGNRETSRQQLLEAGADDMATSLLETRSQLASLKPVIAHEQSRVESAKNRNAQTRSATAETRHGICDDVRSDLPIVSKTRSVACASALRQLTPFEGDITMSQATAIPNAEELAGSWNEIKGRIREKWGQFTDDDLERYKGSADQLVGFLQRETGMARRDIEAVISEASTGASGLLGKVRQEAGEFIGHASETIQKQYGNVSHKVAEEYGDVTALVRENPAASVATSFGAGMLFGVVLMLVLRSR